MKIQGGGATSGAGAASRAPSQAAPGFAPTADAGAARETAAAAPMSGLSGVSSLDALLTLQEAPGPTERRRRAVRRAGRLLDVLDEVKLGLLEERPTDSVLLSLTRAVADQRAETDDPALEGVLNEIETRALVELAKAEVARAEMRGMGAT
jgi:hypothetical protein